MTHISIISDSVKQNGDKSEGISLIELRNKINAAIDKFGCNSIYYIDLDTKDEHIAISTTSNSQSKTDN